jgi:hypothetical protein
MTNADFGCDREGRPQEPNGPLGEHWIIAFREVLTCEKRRAKKRRAALGKTARDAFDAGRRDTAMIPDGGSDE